MDNYLNTKYDLNDNETVSVIDELPLWSAPFGLNLLDKINYKKNMTVLDIGSGSGFPLLEVAMRLGNSCKVYGIDPWVAAVERIKAKIRIYGITNAEIITGAAEKIPLPDKSIDLVISNNGLNNVDDLEKVLRECSRVLKSGSQLLFTFNTDKTMIEFYSVFEHVLREKNMIKEVEMMKEHIYKKRKPVEEIVHLLNKNEYKVSNIINEQLQYKFADASAMFNHFLIKLAFIGSWKEFLPEDRLEEIFKEIELRLNEQAAKTSSFQLTVPFVLIDCKRTV